MKTKWADGNSNGWLHPPRRKTRFRWPCWPQYESCWRRRCTGQGSGTFLEQKEKKKKTSSWITRITPESAATGGGHSSSCNFTVLSSTPLTVITCSNPDSKKIHYSSQVCQVALAEKNHSEPSMNLPFWFLTTCWLRRPNEENLTTEAQHQASTVGIHRVCEFTIVVLEVVQLGERLGL